MSFITDFLNCLCQVLVDFIRWDPKIAMMSFLLVGFLLGRNEPKTETAQ